MSKYQEALMNLDLFCTNHVKGRTNGFRFPRDIATLQELVDKQKPMKPIIWEHKFLKNRCSKCTEGLIPEEDNYCRNCGQKIDWSVEE